jgi:hypothetical protein
MSDPIIIRKSRDAGSAALTDGSVWHMPIIITGTYIHHACGDPAAAPCIDGSMGHESMDEWIGGSINTQHVINVPLNIHDE